MLHYCEILCENLRLFTTSFFALITGLYSMCFINCSSTCPLIGSAILLFDASDRDCSSTAPHYSMRVRVKQLAVSELGLTQPTRQQLVPTGRPLILEVRCLRAPSRAALSPNCVFATHWIWWIHNVEARLLPTSSREWIDATV